MNRDSGKYALELPGRLKGQDALLFSVAESLGVPIEFKVVFKSRGVSYPHAEALGKWLDPTAVYESEEEKMDALYGAIADSTWDCEVVWDEHIPDDHFTSRPVETVEEGVHESSSRGIRSCRAETRIVMIAGNGRSSERMPRLSSTRS